MKLRPIEIALSAVMLVWVQSGSAQVEMKVTQSTTPEEHGELAECKEFIPIANDLHNKIVDYVSYPRPEFNCSNFGKVKLIGSKIYSIVRISNTHFCYEKYCYTFVYNESTKNIMFSMDAENKIDYFHNAEFFVRSLRKIWTHKFDNPTSGVIVITRNGPLAISAINEVLIIEPLESKEGK